MPVLLYAAGLVVIALGIVLVVLQLSTARSRRRPLLLAAGAVALLVGLGTAALTFPVLRDPAGMRVIVITPNTR